MEKQIQFIQTTPEELQKLINEGVQNTLQEFLEYFKQKELKQYITRHEVAKMFGVNIGTVNNWSKEGILKPLGLGKRVYFLASDIEKALNKKPSS